MREADPRDREPTSGADPVVAARLRAGVDAPSASARAPTSSRPAGRTATSSRSTVAPEPRVAARLPARRTRATTSCPTSPPPTTSATAASVAGYWGADRPGRATSNRAGSWGNGVVPTPPGRKRFAVSMHLPAADASSRARTAGCACRRWSTTASPCRRVVRVFPCADYQEREAYDMMGIDFDGPPEPRAHPPARRLGRPPAAQGLPDRRRARPVLGRGLMATRRRQRTRRTWPRRGCSRRSRRCSMPPTGQPGPAGDQPRAEPPVDARRAAARRPTLDGETRGRPAATSSATCTRASRRTWSRSRTGRRSRTRPGRLQRVLRERARLLHGGREAARPRGAAPRASGSARSSPSSAASTTT